jgi:type I restriction enzyme S subunit
MSEWIEKQIGEIGYFKTSGVDKVIKPGEQIVRLVNYMDVYNSVRIDKGFYLSETSATQHEIDSFDLKKGDVLFTPTSETPDDIGHSSVVIEDLDNTLYSYHLTRFREFE